MPNPKAKGSQYEREIAKRLSLWWDPRRDDIFYRSDSSGARSTTRNKQGKQTLCHGDITAVDPVGIPLVDLFTIECKHGYGAKSIQDAVDRLPNTNPSKFEQFVGKAADDAEAAGTWSWLLIMRRHQKREMIYMPLDVVDQLRARRHLWRQQASIPLPSMKVYCHDGEREFGVFGMLFDQFLEDVSRQVIEDMATRL